MYIIMCIVQLKGNDVATVLDSGDRLGRTPLHYAASQKTGPTVSSSVPYQGKIHIGGHVPILNMLHADRSLPISGLSYISNLLKAGANIDAQDHSGMTPLHLACRFGNISLVRTCLQISSDS